jgi:IS30 family transposase
MQKASPLVIILVTVISLAIVAAIGLTIYFLAVKKRTTKNGGGTTENGGGGSLINIGGTWRIQGENIDRQIEDNIDTIKFLAGEGQWNPSTMTVTIRTSTSFVATSTEGSSTWTLSSSDGKTAIVTIVIQEKFENGRLGTPLTFNQSWTKV